MAVPKKKSSPSRRGMRNSHSALPKSTPHVVVDKTSGEYYKRHNILPDGTYRGKQIIVKKEKAQKVENEAE